MSEGGRSGEIAGHQAALFPTEAGIVLRVDERSWRLPDVIVRHVDRDGAVRFTVERDGVIELALEYARLYPTEEDLAFWDAAFMDDEPWDWEDRDFGRFAFAIASGSGPIKYRHRFEHPAAPKEKWGSPPVADEDGLRTGAPWGCSRQEVTWEALTELRIKFEVSSIWAEHSLLVAHAPGALCTLALSETLPAAAALRDDVRQLAGWDGAAEAVLDDAFAYERWFGTADQPEGALHERCERGLWRRS